MTSFKLASRGRHLTDADIQKLEKSLSVRLPESYRDFLLKNNGGAVGRGHFDSLVVEYFYGLGGTHYYDRIEQVIEMLRDSMPAEIIPIAHCAFGDVICLAIKGENHGRIYFWHHEGGTPVDDPWLALRSVLFPERYPDDKPPYTRPLDWPGHPDLTLVAEDFSTFLDTYHDDRPDD